ncbi:MAG: hypothetical protein BJ554DRAFT_7483 [Olpidium bornovanus]|uniref:non-specific serine/threonine protein kinase n=1 Tax=Olpidium bornovanus TaxID=278681 RepID=A0A8H7ZVW9_9FUNG|nr:MAG: hypothetical protein BJ554DRAFT_7483 [Olpidium bornovanus]
MAQIVELLGKYPKKLALSGDFSSQIFNSRAPTCQPCLSRGTGELRNITKLRYWSLRDVLVQKYSFSKQDATEVASFLLPMLEYDPRKRATPQQMLAHAWIAKSEHPPPPLHSSPNGVVTAARERRKSRRTSLAPVSPSVAASASTTSTTHVQKSVAQ